MPVIKPFFALRPHPNRQKEVVTWPLENYSEGQARLILSDNPYSFLHLVNPALDHHYLRGPRQDLLYKKIGENLDKFIENEVLVFDKQASIYIYQTKNDLGVFTGLWTLTAIDSYINGDIKRHELTVERREFQLADYLWNSQLDANPILIAYPSEKKVDQIISKYIQCYPPDYNFEDKDLQEHALWAITDNNEIQDLVETFGKMKAVYIADGHHRAAAMAKVATQMRNLYGLNPDASYGYFNTAYFSNSELKIYAFHRLIKDLGTLSKEEFWKALNKVFEINLFNEPYIPVNKGCFGLYWDKQWFELVVKEALYHEILLTGSPVEKLDVHILHHYLLERELLILDPRTDARLKYEGGRVDIHELMNQIDNQNYTLLFTLSPTTVEEVIRVADAQQNMPPKSTWIAPKFKLGLLSHYLLKK